MSSEEKITIPAFVKWAGGKSQLIEQFMDLFPKNINRYFEPFVGSGAVFFHVQQVFKPKYSLICDLNTDLIHTYKEIKSDYTKLISYLKKHKASYEKNKKEYYYKVREKQPSDPIEIASRFIFLNRTCWNGLYRVNSKGGFNVPMGDFKKRSIVREETLKNASKLLKKTRIENWDFEKIGKLAKKGDFVYFDPPYYPLEGKPSFTTYQKNPFLEDEQIRLKEFFDYLTKKGCLCMLSNSDSTFINKLFKDYNITKVKAKRMINSDAKKRGAITEVVVRNYS